MERAYLVGLSVKGTSINNNTNIVYLFYKDTIKKMALGELKQILLRTQDSIVENITFSKKTLEIKGKYHSLSLLNLQKLTNRYTIALERFLDKMQLLVIHQVNSVDGISLFSEVMTLKTTQNNLSYYNPINYDIKTNSLKCKTNSGLDGLKEKAYDRNALLSFKEFDAFMGYMGWRYTIRDNTLLEIDKKCTLLHMPVGIVSANGVLSERYAGNLDIIVNPECESIINAYVTADKALKSIYFQKGNQPIFSFDGSGLEGLNIGTANMPYAQTIKSLFNCCSIQKLIIPSKMQYGSIKHCFGHVSISNVKDLYFKVTGELTDSFIALTDKNITLDVTGCDIFNTVLVESNDCNIKIIGTGKKPFRMSNSFGWMDDCTVDVTKLDSLESLDSCFRHCNNLNDIRFSKNAPLKIINKCFGHSEELRVEVPDTVTLLSVDKEVDNTFVFTGNRNVLGPDVLAGFTDETKLEFETDTIREVSGKLKLSNIPKTINKIIDDAGFSNLLHGDEVFDSIEYPNFKVYTPRIFEMCTLSKIIIRDAVVIRGSAFTECRRLFNIILGPSIQFIDRHAFSNIHARYIKTNVYVVKGSMTHKLLSNNTVLKDDLNIILMNSLEEAIEHVRNQEEYKLGNIKMMLGMDEKAQKKYAKTLEANPSTYRFIYKLEKLSNIKDKEYAVNKFKSDISLSNTLPTIATLNEETLTNFVMNVYADYTVYITLESPGRLTEVGGCIVERLTKLLLDMVKFNICEANNPKYISDVVTYINETTDQVTIVAGTQEYGSCIYDEDTDQVTVTVDPNGCSKCIFNVGEYTVLMVNRDIKLIAEFDSKGFRDSIKWLLCEPNTQPIIPDTFSILKEGDLIDLDTLSCNYLDNVVYPYEVYEYSVHTMLKQLMKWHDKHTVVLFFGAEGGSISLVYDMYNMTYILEVRSYSGRIYIIECSKDLGSLMKKYNLIKV